MYAINIYGRVIHEFDPWFNFRATQYLADNGMDRFFKWFDYMSWYPLGRPVGTTIYPGMQITSVVIWRVLNAIGISISLNDVCCFVPVWFGVLATLFLGLLTYECSKSANAAVISALIMAIIPAHIMRSVGGGYDNESIAVTAMVSTFYVWCRSLRTPNSWPIGAFAGLAYFYMVAVWGGYIFVLNMIGVHAAGLVILGRYSSNLHRAYSLFYVIGTIGAIQVPVVGWAPLKSLEQLAPCGVFLALQLLEFCEQWRKRNEMSDTNYNRFRLKVFGIVGIVGFLFIQIFIPDGYFGPLSSRIRGLFLKHTRTGNPLVDSVAEHQPGTSLHCWQYLYYMFYIAPFGLPFLIYKRTDATLFLFFYALVAYHFSTKMMRLILILGPISSSLGGIVLASAFEWSVAEVYLVITGRDAKNEKVPNTDGKKSAQDEKIKEMNTDRSQKGKTKNKANKNRNSKKKRNKKNKIDPNSIEDDVVKEHPGPFGPFIDFYNDPTGKQLRKVGAGVFLVGLLYYSWTFYMYCQQIAVQMSNPSIMYLAKLRNGEQIMVDDYREAYWWLRDNTAEDARVMAWWDYGYQITGIANRTTIADGNTWNHEHIATLGRCLSSPEKRAHKIIRHLADYVLIWTGGGGDDLAKSPHMARIGNSVFYDICPDDPTCRQFGFEADGTPTPMMEKSLLYKLHSHNQKPGVQANSSLFKEVYISKYGKVKIFRVLRVSKKSKEWIANPKNRKCDAPGSWYCVGQYPPALDDLMKKKQDFAQLEDFNKKGDARSQHYHKQYHEHMSHRQPGGKRKQRRGL